MLYVQQKAYFICTVLGQLKRLMCTYSSRIGGEGSCHMYNSWIAEQAYLYEYLIFGITKKACVVCTILDS